MNGLFQRALRSEEVAVPPIWLMRQAGRYHAPYQRLRARYGFAALCRTPELAAEVAMGPVLDFDFDAAILFSDLLFPLEALGFGLSYDDGPPALDGSLTFDRLAAFRPLDEAVSRLRFQFDAMQATRAQLPAEKGLVGFVGGPWTLFVYAVEGTHAGPLARAKSSLDLYRGFADRMVPLLVENIGLQFAGGADVVMIFDTAAGELAPDTFRDTLTADLVRLAQAFPASLGYYAKGLRPAHLGDARGRVTPEQRPFETDPRPRRFAEAPWAGLGLDTGWDLVAALGARPRRGFVQGNFDPVLLQLTGSALEAAIDRFVEPVSQLDTYARRGWICGLGHGVLPGTPESSVRMFVDGVRTRLARAS